MDCEHDWGTDPQFNLAAAFFHDSASVGHLSTKFTVRTEISHIVNDETCKYEKLSIYFTNIAVHGAEHSCGMLLVTSKWILVNQTFFLNLE